MIELVEAIEKWPVIVQGAIGSGLFALVMYLGEKIFSAAPRVASRLSRSRRRSYLITKALRLRARVSRDPAIQAYYPSMLWYRASRDIIKAFIWLTLGLLFTNMAGVLGVIGYLGCLYHLFFALEVVKPIRNEIKEAEEELRDVRKQLSCLRGDENA